MNQSHSPFRAVLFDVEGVITRPDPEVMAARLARVRPGLDAAELHRARNLPAQYEHWVAYSVGAMLTADYWADVAVGLGLPATPEVAAGLGAAYSAAAWAWLDAGVLSLAARLRQAGGLRVGLLSNSAPEHENHIPAFEGAFDIAHFSHRTGQRKPDAQAYLAAAAALDVAPGALVFVDDKERNVAAAEAVGMTGRVFTDAQRLAADLAELGLLRPQAGGHRP